MDSNFFRPKIIVPKLYLKLEFDTEDQVLLILLLWLFLFLNLFILGLVMVNKSLIGTSWGYCCCCCWYWCCCWKCCCCSPTRCYWSHYICLLSIDVNLRLLKATTEFLWWWGCLHSHCYVQPNYRVEIMLGLWQWNRMIKQFLFIHMRPRLKKCFHTY